MRTLDEARNQFAYHPAGPETVRRHAALRTAYLTFLDQVWPLIPDGPEKTLALRDLQQSQMHANLAVALTGPVVPPDAPLQVRELAPEAAELLGQVTGQVTRTEPAPSSAACATGCCGTCATPAAQQ